MLNLHKLFCTFIFLHPPSIIIFQFEHRLLLLPIDSRIISQNPSTYMHNIILCRYTIFIYIGTRAKSSGRRRSLPICYGPVYPESRIYRTHTIHRGNGNYLKMSIVTLCRLYEHFFFLFQNIFAYSTLLQYIVFGIISRCLYTHTHTHYYSEVYASQWKLGSPNS